MATFEYSLLQYVGDPVRREALNVGLVVVSRETAEARVVIDRSARTRLKPVWSEYTNRDLFPFARDLRRLTGADHQQFLEEAAESYTATIEGLLLASASSKNRFQLTDLKTYIAESLSEAANNLFRRLVESSIPQDRRDRHMTRAKLRDTMAAIFRTWAAELPEPHSIETDSIINGQITTHSVDLVGYSDGIPSYMFFATPLVGQGATLIRDGLPTVVTDVGRVHTGAKFFAVLGDQGIDWNDPKNPAATARKILANVPRLSVLGLDEFKATFGGAALVSSD